MFFSPSRAVLSAILRDEYLTSAVRTKEGVNQSLISSARRLKQHVHKSGEMQGNVSLERALEYFSEKKGPGSLQMVVEMRSGHDGSTESSRYFT